MNSMRRAVCHMREKWKQTLLVFSIFTLLSVLIQGCLFFERFVEQEKENSAEGSGGTVIAAEESMSAIYPARDNIISQDMVDTLSDFKGVEKISYMNMARVYGEDMSAYWGYYTEEEMEERLGEGWDEETAREFDKRLVHLLGMTDPASYRGFREKEVTLLEGRFPEEGEKGYAIVSSQVAEENNLKPGDKIMVTGESRVSQTLTVIGIHSIEYGNVGPFWMDKVNRIFTDADTVCAVNDKNGYCDVRFHMESAYQVPEFISWAKEQGYTEKINFIEDTMTYRRTEQGIESGGQTAMAARNIIFLSGTLIMILLSIYLMSGRYQEAGILYAMGESRIRIFMQMLIEILIPMLAACVPVMIISFVIMGEAGQWIIFTENICIVIAAALCAGVKMLSGHPWQMLNHR